MAELADAIIVGGGSTGAAIQCALGGAGLGRSVLLERGALAGGPTGRSPAIVRQQYGHPELVRMARHGMLCFRDWHLHSEGSCDYRRLPLLAVAGRDNGAALSAMLDLMRASGVPVETLGQGELSRLAPGIQAADVVLAAVEPEAGYCDPHATTLSFAAQARRHGGTVQQGTQVLELLHDGGRILGVRTTRGDILAPLVVLAAGPWTAALAARAGIVLPIRNVRHSVAQLRRPPAAAPLDFMLADYVSGMYLRPEGAQQCLAGSLRATDMATVADPERYDEGLGEADFVAVAGRVASRLPSWAELGDGGGWSSLLDVTPDGQPLIGPLPQLAGLYVAAGLSGHGFKLCPAIGEMIAAQVTGGASWFDAALFDPGRFAAGAPITPLASFRYGEQG